MTVTWTVVTHCADESTPAIAVSHLARWMADEPSVELHTVVWAPGPVDVAVYDHGRVTDFGRAHHHPAAQGLRKVGLGRAAGPIAGRAVRARAQALPTDGVLYLSTTRSAPILRYLRPGPRTVICHLHPLDRDPTDPPSAERIAQLAEAVDVWLATDEETRAWAASTWGLEPEQVHLVAEPLDPSTWNRSARRSDPGTLRLGLAGAFWFGSDHSARLVQVLHRLDPELALELAWAHQVADAAHLAPLLHDLDHLDAGPLAMPASQTEVLATLDDIDVLAVPTPTEPNAALVLEAASRGVPVVCFATHPGAASVRDGVGIAVEYPDIVAMAEAVLAIHTEDPETGAAVNARRAALRRRDVTLIGPTLLALADAATKAVAP
jgi:glycosyltransferase involved in cell wall biosynthesis